MRLPMLTAVAAAALLADTDPSLSVPAIVGNIAQTGIIGWLLLRYLPDERQRAKEDREAERALFRQWMAAKDAQIEADKASCREDADRLVKEMKSAAAEDRQAFTASAEKDRIAYQLIAEKDREMIRQSIAQLVTSQKSSAEHHRRTSEQIVQCVTRLEQIVRRERHEPGEKEGPCES